MTEQAPDSGVRIFVVRPLCRWWRLTERAARRMVWADLGWTRIGQCHERAGYRKAKIGYWVALEQWHWEPMSQAPAMYYREHRSA